MSGAGLSAVTAAAGPGVNVQGALPLTATLAALDSMELDELRALWRRHYGAPPQLRSPDLLRLILGWRLQAKTLGGIDRATRRKLRLKGAVEAEGLDLGVGTVLTRNWQGKLYEVTVDEIGFRWEGTLYPSLSAAATAITGTRWNGPRFFGLREKK